MGRVQSFIHRVRIDHLVIFAETIKPHVGCLGYLIIFDYGCSIELPNEPRPEKTGFLHMQKQRRRS